MSTTSTNHASVTASYAHQIAKDVKEHRNLYLKTLKQIEEVILNAAKEGLFNCEFIIPTPILDKVVYELKERGFRVSDTTITWS